MCVCVCARACIVVNREPELLDECMLEDEEKKLLLADITQRLTPQAVKIRAGKTV